MTHSNMLCQIQNWFHDPTVVWLFDYDLTLYPWSESCVLHSLDQNINAFIRSRFGVGDDIANQMRKKYWQDHGTTLEGLMRHESIDPHEYFDFIHSNGTLRSPSKNSNLKHFLHSIQGEKYVFTNARMDWALSGLDAIGIQDCFRAIYDLEFFGWKGKPERAVYNRLQSELDLRGRKVVFVDDKFDNLLPAKDLGWFVVWIQGQQDGDIGLIDLALEELADLWNS